MLHFYRQLQPIKVITFDLDDTLYDNYFVIRAAEQAFLDCLQQLAAIDMIGNIINSNFFNKIRFAMKM